MPLPIKATEAGSLIDFFKLQTANQNIGVKWDDEQGSVTIEFSQKTPSTQFRLQLFKGFWAVCGYAAEDTEIEVPPEVTKVGSAGVTLEYGQELTAQLQAAYQHEMAIQRVPGTHPAVQRA